MSLPTGFLDLPNEILEDVIELSGLTLPTLFKLGLSCQRLKGICLPLYLRHSGSPHPEDACKIAVPSARKANFDLKVFALATWITKTKRLECQFVDRRKPTQRVDGDVVRLSAPFSLREGPWNLQKPRRNFKTLLLQLSKLAALITRFTSVDEVVLNFNPEEAAFRGFSPAEATTWSDAMGRLLNVIIQRGCTDLQIRGLNQVNDIYTAVSPLPLYFTRHLAIVDRNPTALVDPRGVQNDILSGPSWTYKWGGRTGSRFEESKPRILTTLSSSAQSGCQLTALTIASVSLLLPPVLQWTCSILSCPSIVSLTLCGIPEFEINWLVLGTHFAKACPSLKRFTLSTDNVDRLSWNAMKSFLCTFQKLEYLSADDLDTPSWISIRGAAQGLHLSRHIKELRLSENWIQYLDSNLQDLPDLKKLSVLVAHDRSRYGLSVPHRTAGVTEIHFALNPESVSDGDIIRMPLAHVVQVLEGAFWPTDAVSSVELVFADPTCFVQQELWAQGLMKRWFAKFTRLKGVTMTSREGVKKLDSRIATIEHFCRCIMVDVMKSLDRFEVDGRVWGTRRIGMVMKAEKSAHLS